MTQEVIHKKKKAIKAPKAFLLVVVLPLFLFALLVSVVKEDPSHTYQPTYHSHLAVLKLVEEKYIRTAVYPVAPLLLCYELHLPHFNYTDVEKTQANVLLIEMRALVDEFKSKQPNTIERVCGSSPLEAASRTAYHQWWRTPLELKAQPSRTLRWKRDNAYLLVSFALTIDDERRAKHRKGQRNSFLRYKGVATERNGFNGKALFLFLACAHYSTKNGAHIGFSTETPNAISFLPLRNATPSLLKEALLYKDVLWIADLTDQPPSSGKKYEEGGGNGWGTRAEVTMSMKLIRGLLYTAYQFPHAKFVQKTDDDVFFKIPQFLRDLGRFQEQVMYYNNYALYPYRLTYLYGGIMKWYPDYVKPLFASGMSEFVGQDLLQYMLEAAKGNFTVPTPHSDNTTFTTLIGLTLDAYDNEKQALYTRHFLHHEDVFLGYLVGLLTTHAYEDYKRRDPKTTFSNSQLGKIEHVEVPKLLNYVKYHKCRAHDLDTGSNVEKTVLKSSVIVHHVIHEDTFYDLLVFFTQPKPFCQQLLTATPDAFDLGAISYPDAKEKFYAFCEETKDYFNWGENDVFETVRNRSDFIKGRSLFKAMLAPPVDSEGVKIFSLPPELYDPSRAEENYFDWWDLMPLYDAEIPLWIGNQSWPNHLKPLLSVETHLKCDSIQYSRENII